MAMHAPFARSDRKVWIGIERDHAGKRVIPHGLEDEEFANVGLALVKR